MKAKRQRSFGRFFLIVLGCLLMFTGLAQAIPVGVVSFDNLIPDVPSAPGLNAFGIFNLTGGFALPPDFPVTDALTFRASSLVVTLSDGSTVDFILGDIEPGAVDPTLLALPTTQSLLGVLFTATASPLNFVADGIPYEALSPTLTAMLLRSSGQFLTPGVDFVVLDLPAQPVTAVPEPSRMVLLAIGLAAFFCYYGIFCLTVKRRNSSMKP